MLPLLLFAFLFVGIHFGVSGTALRGRLVDKIGERAYLGLFSLASLGAIVGMSISYSAAPVVVTWGDPLWARHFASVAVLFAFILVVLGVSTPNPTAVSPESGQKNASSRMQAKGIVKVTRHPFMWGVVIWAFAHILANGEVRALILFGTFFLVALIGPFLIDSKKRRRDPEAWAAFAGETSWFPFAAIVSGRNRVSLKEIGYLRLLVAIGLYVVLMYWLHEWLFGLSPLP